MKGARITNPLPTPTDPVRTAIESFASRADRSARAFFVFRPNEFSCRNFLWCGELSSLGKVVMKVITEMGKTKRWTVDVGNQRSRCLR